MGMEKGPINFCSDGLLVSWGYNSVQDLMSDNIHPEMQEGPLGDVLRAVGAEDTCEVWCTGCKSFVRMNAKYAKIIGTGEIASCHKCRD